MTTLASGSELARWRIMKRPWLGGAAFSAMLRVISPRPAGACLWKVSLSSRDSVWTGKVVHHNIAVIDIPSTQGTFR
jgi:hypothetical protein